MVSSQDVGWEEELLPVCRNYQASRSTSIAAGQVLARPGSRRQSRQEQCRETFNLSARFIAHESFKSGGATDINEGEQPTFSYDQTWMIIMLSDRRSSVSKHYSFFSFYQPARIVDCLRRTAFLQHPSQDRLRLIGINRRRQSHDMEAAPDCAHFNSYEIAAVYLFFDSAAA
jgi:hypothetical protein